MMSSSNPLVLETRSLTVGYGHGDAEKIVIEDVALRARRGRITGIVGESGSGKTTAVLASIGLAPSGSTILSGKVLLDGESVLSLDRDGLRRLWARSVSYIAQDAAGALNPFYTIGAAFRQVLPSTGGGAERTSRERAIQLLQDVHLTDAEEALKKYPHQFSGGQLQRITIALGLATEPELLILDEPTTGLDVTTQSEVVAMLRQLILERQIAALYISHDLALLGAISDDLCVLYSGQIVEEGETADVIHNPKHPYTRGLLGSTLSTHVSVRPYVMPGQIPGRVLAGQCGFAARCEYVVDKCLVATPALQEISAQNRRVRCIRVNELTLRPVERRVEEAAAPHDGQAPLLDASDIRVVYGRGARARTALDGVSIRMDSGEIVALVGESGSGKTTLGRVIAGLQRPIEGSLHWRGGEPIPFEAVKRSTEQRRSIQLIFQNATAALNPRLTIGQSLLRPITLFRDDLRSANDRRETAREALRQVNLPAEFMDRFPHQLSGGQKQRAAIARAFVAQPDLIICDEIVSSQDVSVQAAILELLRELVAESDTALLFITHDLAVVRSIAHRVHILKSGGTVETGPTRQVFEDPQDPYTRELLAAASAVEARLESR